MAKSVFYSFYYDEDYWRVQQIINMGAVEGQPILNSQDWEEVKRKGDAAIEEWIHTQMSYKSAVVVLIGAETASRPWVRHEIAHAWDNRKPLVGVRIHGLADSSGSTASWGDNPFSKVNLKSGGTVADHVPVYNPSGYNSQTVYADIKTNLSSWVDGAFRRG
ncbi:TIR domain-containing protein [Paenarthrobacter ureafaciens]